MEKITREINAYTQFGETEANVSLNLYVVVRRLQDRLEPLARYHADVEIHNVLARFMTDVIEEFAFGFESDCLGNLQSQFREMGRKMINFLKSEALKAILASTLQRKAQQLSIRWNDEDLRNFH